MKGAACIANQMPMISTAMKSGRLVRSSGSCGFRPRPRAPSASSEAIAGAGGVDDHIDERRVAVHGERLRALDEHRQAGAAQEREQESAQRPQPARRQRRDQGAERQIKDEIGDQVRADRLAPPENAPPLLRREARDATRVEVERIERRVDHEEHGEREQPGGGSAQRAFGCVDRSHHAG